MYVKTLLIDYIKWLDNISKKEKAIVKRLKGKGYDKTLQKRYKVRD